MEMSEQPVPHEPLTAVALPDNGDGRHGPKSPDKRNSEGGGDCPHVGPRARDVPEKGCFKIHRLPNSARRLWSSAWARYSERNWFIGVRAWTIGIISTCWRGEPRARSLASFSWLSRSESTMRGRATNCASAFSSRQF